MLAYGRYIGVTLYRKLVGNGQREIVVENCKPLWVRSKQFLQFVITWFPLFLGGTILPAIPIQNTVPVHKIPASAIGAYFYAAPDGQPEGDGSLAKPWDLATALNHPTEIQPGDTIWLRGGTYPGVFTSWLTGTPAAPITVRSYPGEWAVIDTRADSSHIDAFIINSQWTYYRDFELKNSRTSNRSPGGFGIKEGNHNKFINMVIHDVGNNAFGGDNEIYGSILYNNGVDGTGQHHHLYTQNDDPTHPTRIVDCIIFNGFAFGIHAYAESGSLKGIHMIGNIWFNNGVANTDDGFYANTLVGGHTIPENILLEKNLGWMPDPALPSIQLGRYNDTNNDVRLINNYLVGEINFFNTWQSVTMTGNTFYIFGPGDGTNVDPVNFPDNTYLTVRPTEAKVFIRPNQYESGRAHIAVYNWNLEDEVAVDLSGLLETGTPYEIRNAQNYFAPPVVSGTYDGQPVMLPMAGLIPAQPIGPGLIKPEEFTGKEFNVFVLVSAAGNDISNSMVYLPVILKDSESICC